MDPRISHVSSNAGRKQNCVTHQDASPFGQAGPGVDSRARAAFHEAVEGIPDKEKIAYLQALARAPQLVEDESNPDHYLECAGFDPWKAALHVVRYWQARVDIFGGRAFLPLTITGEGALSHEDVAVLNTGFLMVLPSESKGRVVLLHDRSRLTSSETIDPMRRLRCVFYVLSTLAETATNRRNGFVMLTFFGKTTRKATLGFNTFSKLYEDILLVRLVTAHVVFLSSRPVLKTFVNLFVAASDQLRFLKGRILVHDHSESRPEAILKDLEQHGFDVEGLPKSPLGGLFTFGCFTGWLEDRRRLERRRYAASLQTPGASDAASTGVATEDESRKRKRLDAAYSRRKRYRKKVELEVLKEEVDRLRQQNAKLREQERELEWCLFESLEVVKSYLQPTGCSTGCLGSLEARTKPYAALGVPPRSSKSGVQGMDFSQDNPLALSLSASGNTQTYPQYSQVPQLFNSSGTSQLLLPNRSFSQFSFLQQMSTRPQWASLAPMTLLPCTSTSSEGLATTGGVMVHLPPHLNSSLRARPVPDPHAWGLH